MRGRGFVFGLASLPWALYVVAAIAEYQDHALMLAFAMSPMLLPCTGLMLAAVLNRSSIAHFGAAGFFILVTVLCPALLILYPGEDVWKSAMIGVLLAFVGVIGAASHFQRAGKELAKERRRERRIA